MAKVIQRDPGCYNTPSGRAHPAPDVKESGAATIARVMRKAETPQCTATGGAVTFTIEDGNRAKRINQDAYPK